VEEETLQWGKVAEMIGSTLEDVCNMGSEERNDLLSLLPSENSQFVNVNELLGEDENSDAKKLPGSSEPGHGSSTNESASPQHSPSTVEQKLNKSVEDVFCGSQVLKMKDLDRKARNTSDKNEVNSTLNNKLNKSQNCENNDHDNFKMQFPNTSTEETKEMEADENCLEIVDESKTTKVYSVVYENYDKIMESILRLKDSPKLGHDDVRKIVTGKISSISDCFKMMEESPEKYKFDIKKVYDNTMTKTLVDGSLMNIFKIFGGVKQIKSITVAGLEEELPLVRISPDSSVKNGFKTLSPVRNRKIKNIFDTPSFVSPDTENTLLMEILKEQRTDFLGRTRASTSASVGRTRPTAYHQPCYNVDDLHDYEPFCDVDEYDFDGDVDENDYVETNKKLGKAARGTNGKKSGGMVNKKRKSPESDVKNGSTNDKVMSTSRGIKASKRIGSIKTESPIEDFLATSGSPGMSSRSNNTGRKENSVEEFETSVEISINDRQETSVEEFEALSALTGGSEEIERSSPEVTPTQEIETCPSCRRPFKLSQVEKHLFECNGGVAQLEEHDVEEKDFCDLCAQMVPKSSFESHQNGCLGFQSLQQRILKKIEY